MLKLHNMTVMSPAEQMTQFFDNFERKWGFDFTPTFTGIETKDKYPKYTILKSKEDENKIKIKLAAAGLDKDCFKITTLKNKICIKYDDSKKEMESDEYEVVTNTISHRQFEQYFTAPESYVIKVDNIELKDGMLLVDIHIEIPEDMKEVEHTIK